MHMFVIRAIAERDNPHYATVQQAKVHIWVAMEDQSQAEAAAYEYIRSYKWIPQEIEYAFAIQPELIPQLHEDEARLYHKAQQYGVAADFVASPRIERDPTDGVEFHRLHREEH